MKVYTGQAEERRLIGRADIPHDASQVYEVPLFGAASIIVERYTIGAVTHLNPGHASPIVERAVLLAEGQPPELLPGWQPLAS